MADDAAPGGYRPRGAGLAPPRVVRNQRSSVLPAGPACGAAAADRLLGSSTRQGGALLRYLPERATAEQKERARSSALYQRGDMRLVWISEGDLATLAMAGAAVGYGAE